MRAYGVAQGGHIEVSDDPKTDGALNFPSTKKARSLVRKETQKLIEELEK